MFKKIITVLGIWTLLSDIYCFTQGYTDSNYLVPIIGVPVCLIIIWLPPRWLYKVKPLKNFDKTLFKYSWYRRFVRFLVGNKEYDEIKSLLKK